MLINEVETVVGLSKKSIRYYEQVGLFTPKRTNNNDYRNYTEEDIKILKKIKFLRELDVSINELKKLTNKELSLKECMQDRITKLETYEKNYQKIKHMCNEISNTNIEYEKLNIDKYYEHLNILNKELKPFEQNLGQLDILIQVFEPQAETEDCGNHQFQNYLK